MKKFDLNIQNILENWGVHHAVRELIANAFDEQCLSQTQDIKIYKENECWYIRDYGRGLNYIHLTLNENIEKLNHSNVIGRFGIGLKDALATFNRHGISVTIKSKFNQITIEKSEKENFSDLLTLHAVIEENVDPNFVGTEISLVGINDSDINSAKNFFLKFSNEKIIQDTQTGQVIDPLSDVPKIYVNGIKIAEEPNFLFSYNITAINSQIKKSLNRERTNVGRSAYTDSIKKILLSSTEEVVLDNLIRDLKNIDSGQSHDELSWIDVQEHALKKINETQTAIFVSSNQAMSDPDIIDEARRSNAEVIVLPQSLISKVMLSKDSLGNDIRTYQQYVTEFNESFSFKFVNENDLTDKERVVFNFKDDVIELFGGVPNKVKFIKVSETMRKESNSNERTLGCWDSETSSIVIARKQLDSIENFSATLIHELIHAETGLPDVSREFESSLTEYLGKFCKKIIAQDKVVSKSIWQYLFK